MLTRAAFTLYSNVPSSPKFCSRSSSHRCTAKPRLFRSGMPSTKGTTTATTRRTTSTLETFFIQSFAPRSSGALSHTGEPSKKAESKNFHQLLSAAATSSYFFLLSTIAKRKMEKSTASCKAASKYYEQTLLFAHNTTPIFCSVVCPVHTILRRAQLFGKCVWHARASAVAW